MDCYIIPPLQHLDLMYQGDRYFCLAHFYLQYEHYRRFFNTIKQQGKFITLDNSAAERSLVTTEALLRIVKELEPNEVIAPDILLDSAKTTEHLHEFLKEMKTLDLLQKTAVFGCAQGQTKEEWLDSYKEMLTIPEIQVIGLSKISVPYCWANKATNDHNIKEGRHKCVSYLIEHNLLQKPLHCLGMGDPREYKQYNNTLLRSTDSCYTVLAAKNNISFTDGQFERIETTNAFYDEKLTDTQLRLAKQNIDFLKTQLR